MIDDKTIEMLLAMGTDEEALTELLRQQGLQEDRIDGTRNKEYGMMAGNTYVANPAGAIADMFVRGNAEKKIKKLEGKQTENRRVRDSKTKQYADLLLNRTPGTVPVDSSAPQGQPPPAAMGPPAAAAPAPMPAGPPQGAPPAMGAPPPPPPAPPGPPTPGMGTPQIAAPAPSPAVGRHGGSPNMPMGAPKPPAPAPAPLAAGAQGVGAQGAMKGLGFGQQLGQSIGPGLQEMIAKLLRDG